MRPACFARGLAQRRFSTCHRHRDQLQLLEPTTERRKIERLAAKRSHIDDQRCAFKKFGGLGDLGCERVDAMIEVGVEQLEH